MPPLLVPVSRMLNIQIARYSAQYTAVQDTLTAVDNYHYCWRLQEKASVLVADFKYQRHTRRIVDRGGLYTWENWPPDIVIGANAPDAQLVFLHELGHYLDHLFLDFDNLFASCATPRLPDIEAWLQAVQDSRLIKEIIAFAPTVTSQEESDYVDYVLDPKELWACSYAQWLAETYATDELKRQMDAYRNPNDIVRRHWETDDFADINKAVKQILGERGWLL